MTAVISPKSQLFTAEELYDFPSEARFELVRGELRPMPPPAGEEHGATTFSLASRLGVFIEDNDLGRGYASETGFILTRDPDTLSAPDFAFTAKARLTEPPRKGFAVVVPDLILETRSPHDRPGEVAQKVADWLAAGVKVVWELNLKARVLTVHRADTELVKLTAADALDGGDLLPGFSLPLKRLLGEQA